MRKMMTNLVLVMLGIGFSVWGWGLISDARSSLSWPTATGKVIYSSVKNYTSFSDGKSTQMYSADIKYKYSVNKKTYISEDVSLGDHSANSSGGMRELTELYPVGKSITVYYYTDKPNSALLEPGPAFITYLPFAFGVLAVIAVLVAFVWKSKPMPPPGSRHSGLVQKNGVEKRADSNTFK